MATFSLDQIRDAAEAKYGSTTINDGEGDIVLVNALQLPKDRRDSLIELQTSLGDEGANQEAILCDILRKVILDHDAAERLIGKVGGNLAVLMQIFESYGEGTQLGEASASDD